MEVGRYRVNCLGESRDHRWIIGRSGLFAKDGWGCTTCKVSA